MSDELISWLAMAGLASDILGGLFLAKGFMVKSLKTIRKEGGTYFGSNLFLRDSFIKQRAEAWVGGGFLALGFLLQFLSYALRIPYGLRDLLMTLVVLAALFVLLLTLIRCVSHNIIKKLNFTELEREILKCEKSYQSQIHHNLKGWGEELNLQQLGGESDSDFLGRIKAALAKCPKYDIKLLD